MTFCVTYTFHELHIKLSVSHNQNQNAVHAFQNYGPSQFIFSNNGQHMLFQFTVKVC